MLKMCISIVNVNGTRSLIVAWQWTSPGTHLRRSTAPGTLPVRHPQPTGQLYPLFGKRTLLPFQHLHLRSTMEIPFGGPHQRTGRLYHTLQGIRQGSIGDVLLLPTISYGSHAERQTMGGTYRLLRLSAQRSGQRTSGRAGLYRTPWRTDGGTHSFHLHRPAQV